MHTEMTTEEEETHRGFYQAQAGVIENDGGGDTGHLPDRFPGATLIERVVGFIESYHGSSYA
jgi:hypothetical protein